MKINFLGIENQSLEIKSAANIVKNIWESRLGSRKNVSLDIEVKFVDFASSPDILGNSGEGLDPRLLELQNKGFQNLTKSEKKEFTARKLPVQSTLGVTSTKDNFYIESEYIPFLNALALSGSSSNDKLAIESLNILKDNKQIPSSTIRLGRPNGKALGLVNDGKADARIFINTNLASFNNKGKSQKFV
jgi:hypothetical protein